MEEKMTFKVVNDEGKEVECEVLFTFESDETKKNYIVYTDNTLDEEGNTKVYASIYNPDEDETKLLPIEYDEIQHVYSDNIYIVKQGDSWKIINTSNIQLENIKKLKEKKDFDLLDEKIKEICIYKEKYPESSMQELAEIISNETGKKITKSGINHRFRKISELVNKD